VSLHASLSLIEYPNHLRRHLKFLNHWKSGGPSIHAIIPRIANLISIINEKKGSVVKIKIVICGISRHYVRLAEGKSLTASTRFWQGLFALVHFYVNNDRRTINTWANVRAINTVNSLICGSAYSISLDLVGDVGSVGGFL